MATTEHAYGVVTHHADMECVTIEATGNQLWQWSHRSGATWPCSALDDLDFIRVVFDADGLLEIEATCGGKDDDAEGLTADELNAWSGDVLRDVLASSHPAYFVTVGQFDEPEGISAEGQRLGHRYVMGNVNAYCPTCSDEQGVTVLDCQYDLDK
jgi:hypothetical protein